MASVGALRYEAFGMCISNNANWFASKDSVISQADKITKLSGDGGD